MVVVCCSSMPHLFYHALPCCTIPTTPLDKTIKLWKIYEKTVKEVTEHTAQPASSGSNAVLRFPKMVVADSFIAAQPKKVFSNAHMYHINSISCNSDGETFISADDLRINLWNFHHSDQSFSTFRRE